MPGERLFASSCLWRMTADSKATTTIKRKIALYFVGMFSVVLMAAIGGNQNAIQSATASESNNDVDAKIRSFRRQGEQKEINVAYYDVEDVIRQARALLGTRHVMGGYSSRGIDCSGLVKLAHAKANVDLPRSSHDQARYGMIIPRGQELRRGDIIFFHSTYKKANLVTHTGIYLGDNEFIHTSSRRGVTISKLNSDYYRKHYLFATRLGS
jgi:murein DD-endopeptidase / murein LD-carboxypeptidase